MDATPNTVTVSLEMDFQSFLCSQRLNPWPNQLSLFLFEKYCKKYNFCF